MAPDYAKHQAFGAIAFQQGRYRESADEYWKSFLSIPRADEFRYYVLHGCTSTLRLGYFEANESDFHNMRSLFEDKNEPARDERHKCEDIYHHARSIGEKKLKKEKDIKNEETLIQKDNERNHGGTIERLQKEPSSAEYGDQRSSRDSVHRCQ